MQLIFVALLAEGVDRNFAVLFASLSKRVALLAEGVDRNQSDEAEYWALDGRPPRGGRG